MKKEAWEIERDQVRADQDAIRDRLRRDYEWREVTSVIAIIAGSAGKQVQEVLGVDTQTSYHDYIHAVLFTDGTGVALKYSAEIEGYSEYTPGSPAETEYFLLTARGAGAGDVG